MSEYGPRGPEITERDKWYAGRIIVACVEVKAMEPTYSVSVETSAGHIWAAGYEVTPEFVEELRVGVASKQQPDHTLGLTLDMYRHVIAGHWIVSGMDEMVDRAFRFENQEQLDKAFEMAEDWIGGGDNVI